MPRREECKLRPVAVEDLDRLLQWRNSERIRSNMYTDHVISPEEHRAWFERCKMQQSSVHLLFEVRDRPAGLVYFTDIDRQAGRSFWGFYLGEENLPKGCGMALGVLGVEHAFIELDIRKLCGQAFAFNDASIRFHTRLGFKEEGRFAGHILKRGDYQDVVQFALFQDDWRLIRDDLTRAGFTSATSQP